MTRTVLIGDRSPATDAAARALAADPYIELVARLGIGRTVAGRLALLLPDLTIIQEPASAPLPIAVIREARKAVPAAR